MLRARVFGGEGCDCVRGVCLVSLAVFRFGDCNLLMCCRLCFALTFGLAVMHVINTRGRASNNDKANPNNNVAEGV